MDSGDIIIFILLGIMIGMILVAVVAPNVSSDIGLSQQAGNKICQTLKNNTNYYAVDWNHKYNQPRDSLVCKSNQTEQSNLIQVLN